MILHTFGPKCKFLILVKGGQIFFFSKSLRGEMKILEPMGLNGIVEKLRGSKERVEMQLEKVQRAKVQFQNVCKCETCKITWPPVEVKDSGDGTTVRCQGQVSKP